MSSPDKNEPSTITGSRFVGGNIQKYGLFCKTRPLVAFVMSKFSEAELGEGTVHFASQQKTRSSEVVFDVALAVRPIRNNTFEIN